MLYLVLSAALVEAIVAAYLAIKLKNASSKKHRLTGYLLPVTLIPVGVIVFVIGLGVFLGGTTKDCTGWFECSSGNSTTNPLLPPLQLNSTLMYLGPYIILAALYWLALMTKHRLRAVLIVAAAVLIAFSLIYNNIWHT